MCFELESSSLEADIVSDQINTLARRREQRDIIPRGAFLTTNVFLANHSLSLRTTVGGMDVSPVRGTLFILQYSIPLLSVEIGLRRIYGRCSRVLGPSIIFQE